jgi:hypothetical protein
MWQKRIKQGYVYAAVGDEFIQEALVSIESLRKHSPNAHITLLTDSQVTIKEVDLVKVIKFHLNSENRWKPGTLFKVRALQESPYEKTFFIDTDTFFCDNCEELFPLLDYFHLLICHAPADKSRVVLSNGFLDGYFPYNTGVIVFNNQPAVKKFLTKWYNVYSAKFSMYPHDQTPFMEALLYANLKTYTLQSIYNFRIPFSVSIFGKKVKILHGRCDGQFQELAEIVNSTDLHRVWSPSKRSIEVVPKAH